MTDRDAQAEAYAAELWDELLAGWPTNSTYGTCSDPQFTWMPVRECWSACTTCGRLAWSHAQADPLQDMRNYAAYLRGKYEGRPVERQLPAMRPFDNNGD